MRSSICRLLSSRIEFIAEPENGFVAFEMKLPDAKVIGEYSNNDDSRKVAMALYSMTLYVKKEKME